MIRRIALVGAVAALGVGAAATALAAIAAANEAFARNGCKTTL
jgi:hypothetical protein